LNETLESQLPQTKNQNKQLVLAPTKAKCYLYKHYELKALLFFQGVFSRENILKIMDEKNCRVAASELQEHSWRKGSVLQKVIFV
jgi:hypothetical protein